MPQTIDLTLDPSMLSLEQLNALLQLLQPLVGQLEDAYYHALLMHRQHPLPGIPQAHNDTPFNDPLPF
ncbi:MAG: hypothetical protein EA370_16375 [Wenzhouxiangella sp.]|nr:MAG: hypothetical protein EA370_16375 [Wenzhouxiangella sp.]